MDQQKLSSSRPLAGDQDHLSSPATSHTAHQDMSFTHRLPAKNTVRVQLSSEVPGSPQGEPQKAPSGREGAYESRFPISARGPGMFTTPQWSTKPPLFSPAALHPPRRAIPSHPASPWLQVDEWAPLPSDESRRQAAVHRIHQYIQRSTRGGRRSSAAVLWNLPLVTLQGMCEDCGLVYWGSKGELVSRLRRAMLEMDQAPQYVSNEAPGRREPCAGHVAQEVTPISTSLSHEATRDEAEEPVGEGHDNVLTPNSPLTSIPDQRPLGSISGSGTEEEIGDISDLHRNLIRKQLRKRSKLQAHEETEVGTVFLADEVSVRAVGCERRAETLHRRAWEQQVLNHLTDAEEVVGWLLEAHIRDICSIDAEGETIIIGTGASVHHVRAVVGGVRHMWGKKLQDLMSELSGDLKLPSLRGHNKQEWMSVRAGSLAVHIFTPEARAFFDLEAMFRNKGTIRHHSRSTPIMTLDSIRST